MELQIGMKLEVELAMRLLEKDIHEKQDSIVILRKQLDDIKAINLEMYNKLKVGFVTSSWNGDQLPCIACSTGRWRDWSIRAG